MEKENKPIPVPDILFRMQSFTKENGDKGIGASMVIDINNLSKLLAQHGYTTGKAHLFFLPKKAIDQYGNTHFCRLDRGSPFRVQHADAEEREIVKDEDPNFKEEDYLNSKKTNPHGF